METWKYIESNPDYQVSNLGRVRNASTGRILKPTIHYNKSQKNPVKYWRIELKNPRKKYMIHRLVAITFIDNPDNLPQVNHKDENSFNNNVGNLEWCDNTYNCTYSQGRSVKQIDIDGSIINSFKSLTEAAKETGSTLSLIQKVCAGERRTHNNFIWRYA